MLNNNRFTGTISELEISGCVECKYWNKGKCLAFPDGIPLEILKNDKFHFEKIKGQVGNYVFTKKESKK